MRCGGMQELAETAYLSWLPFSALPYVAPYCVPGGVRVVSELVDSRVESLGTYLTAHCSDSEPMRTWLHDERLLGRSQTKDSFRRRRRDAQGSGGSHLLREPLLGQTIRKQGLTRRIPGPQEAPRIRSEARRDG